MRHIMLVAAVSVAAVALGCKASKPQMPPPPPPRVTVITPVSVPVSDYWFYNGYLETTEAVEVRSKIRGFLTDIKFTEGAEVEAGEDLYTIDKREFETARMKAEAEVKNAEAQIKVKEAQQKQSESDLARARESYSKGTIGKADLDLAQATYEVRVAEVKAAIANHDAAKAAHHSTEIIFGYTDIKAKINGRISRTLVDKGNLVQADTTLLTTIVRIDELYVYFDAPEADLVAYQRALLDARRKSANGQDLPPGTALATELLTLFTTGSPTRQDVRVEVGVTKEEGYPHVGEIDFRENRVETATGTQRIRGRLKNPLVNHIRLLYPGMYARVRVLKSDPVPQLVVPEDCLLSAQEGRFLYVLGADNKVEKRIVTVGASVWKAPPTVPGVSPPGWVALNPNPQKPPEGQPPAPTRRQIKSVVAITAGLQPSDRVILDGIQKVRPGSPVDPEMWNITPPAK